mmetsp:Transcript_103336/g.287680  ORF Transcript_103336/g.287680 Transcript_103336/m.287680 type:complete len:209 (-) Transcript_103336:625-1251(-)
MFVTEEPRIISTSARKCSCRFSEQASSCSSWEASSRPLASTMRESSWTTATCLETLPDMRLNSGYSSTKRCISSMDSIRAVFFVCCWYSSTYFLMLTPKSPKFARMLSSKNWSCVVDMTISLSSGRMPGTLDMSMRLFSMDSSSCSIAWYVHWFSSGVTGSLRRSNSSSTGVASPRRSRSTVSKRACSSLSRACSRWATCRVRSEASV